MQVLLPDFMFRKGEEEQNTIKSRRNFFAMPRPKTMQMKRICNSVSTPIKREPKLNEGIRKQCLSSCFSTFTPKPVTFQPFTRTASRQIDFLNLVGQNNDQPIHSHRQNRLVSTLQMRKSSYHKKSSNKRSKQYDKAFNFLTTHKYQMSFHPTIEIDEPFEGLQHRSRKSSKSFNSKFPTKKVKSAFVIEQYRPWSPKKGQFCFDEIAS